ncbi:hypothetical protein FISHEDRAFT_71766 [Fistulina hepatica ATCC 64428]|uniref:Transcription factor IIA, alpha/beta subunit n=1 Tax=Fistulina hepatica ATCC 64428 TaxID=1128425 RepID=A0A0D7AIJ5_9AGAR|nr:hypothetical protein FISHEDRAFT_71766 [Fistulina hepatica ATCC 64428]
MFFEPAIYRAVIDDVIENIKPDFEGFGIPADVLADLQRKWEDKVIASNVADFESPAAAAPATHVQQQPHIPIPQPGLAPPHLPYQMYPYGYAQQQLQSTQQGVVKSEPVETGLDASRYLAQYNLPILAGPQIAGARSGTAGLSFPHIPAPHSNSQPQNGRIPQADGPSGLKVVNIPQIDGPTPTPVPPRPSHPSLPPPTYPPQASSSTAPSSSQQALPSLSSPAYPVASHPSLPAPPQPGSKNVDDDEINSDLDDSDDSDAGDEDPDENHPSVAVDNNIVFCTYDKVARVKNKWKIVLKDGMIHVQGKDYLFAKCNG